MEIFLVEKLQTTTNEPRDLSSVLTRPLVGGTVPHCFAMYVTATLLNHMHTSLLPSLFTILHLAPQLLIMWVTSIKLNPPHVEVDVAFKDAHVPHSYTTPRTLLV